MKWSYTQTDVTRVDDGKSQVDISSVIPLDGTPYERLITRNGHPLSPDERRREDANYDKELRRRESETPQQREARIRNYEKERSFLSDLPNAYDFMLGPEDVVNGRPAWTVILTPHAGFQPTMPHAGLLRHIEGKLWIDKKELQWAKAEADVIDTVNIGLIVARIGHGAHITLDFTRMSDTLWVPKGIYVRGEAKILLIHSKNLNEDVTFSNYTLPSPATAAQVASR